MEIKIKIDFDVKDIVALKILTEGLEEFGYLSENDAEKIEKIFLIKEYLEGGLRTTPTNFSIADVRDTKNEWRKSKGNDVRIEMYRLDELDDIINSENDIMIKHFIEQIWLDTVMDDDMPWLILDAIELESLRSSMVMQETMSAIIRRFEEGLDRNLETDTIQEISVPISDDETSGMLFG